MGIIQIKKGREKPIRNQHPWIFSGAIAKVEGAADGDIVTVVDHKEELSGAWLLEFPITNSSPYPHMA